MSLVYFVTFVDNRGHSLHPKVGISITWCSEQIQITWMSSKRGVGCESWSCSWSILSLTFCLLLLALLKLKETLSLNSNNWGISNVNVCGIVLDICVAIMRNFTHIRYLKAVDLSLIKFPVVDWKMCLSKWIFACRTEGYPAYTEEGRGSDHMWSLESLCLLLQVGLLTWCFLTLHSVYCLLC